MLEYEGLEKEILDELSDGQWHPVYKIRKELGDRLKTSRDFKSKVNKSLEVLTKDSTIILGANESYRMLNPNLEIWRSNSDSKLISHKNKQPRYFGGYLEDDGWLKSPLKEYDMVHFRMSEYLTSAEIRTLLGDKNLKVFIDHTTQLIRIFVNPDYDIKGKLLAIKEEVPSLGIHSVRLEKNLRRRDIDDLPVGFMDGLCTYYGKFARVLLRPYMSSIDKHIKEADDVQQQVYIWIIEAVQRYDAETSIPFAAYLASSLKKWVFNLARESYGRSIADIELKHARAANEFRSEHGREPNTDELIAILQSSGAGISKDKLAMASVNNIRNTTTIHQEDGDIQIDSGYIVEDEMSNMIEASIISASVIKASEKSRNQAVALLVLYYTTWGSEKQTKKIAQFLSSEVAVRTRKEALKIMQQILKENEE